MRKLLHLKGQLSLTLVTLLMLFAYTLNSAPKHNLPIIITQPDGTKISCFVSGDEFYNWLHDANGYTIIQSPKTGYYVYAVKVNGKLVASDFVVGKTNPQASKSLTPYENISRDEYLAKRAQKHVNNHYISLLPSKEAQGIAPLKTKSGETMNNVVVFIKFADDAVSNEDISYYENIYNGTTESVQDYYSSVSYDKFTVSTTFYPASSGGYVVWYTDSHNRAYYQPYNAVTNTQGYDPDIESSTDTQGQTYREHTLLVNAVNAVSSAIPTSINLDINNDGYVDVVSFIVAGSNDGWGDLLWPHQWSLSQSVSINGKQVGDYTFQLQFFGSNRIDLGTLCHEMFHVVGAPDLYYYSDNSTISPVGIWDVMEGTLNYPQNMGAYMKYLYGGWIDNIPEITTSGTYTLSPLATSSTENSYRIPSPNSYSEYFVVEYRDNQSYDRDLPSKGMLVYRINSYLEGVGNADGPPDEVYIYRPYGTTVVNGIVNNATFNSSLGRTSINDQTNPRSFLADGSDGGLKISNVTSADETISFDVDVDFTPFVVLKNDNGLASGIGNGSTTFTVATRFTTSDLTSLVGREIVKVDFFLNSYNSNDVTTNEMVKVWEGGSYGNSGTLIYSQNVSSEVKVDEWTSHTLTQPVQIKADKEYWVGYTVTASSGYPIAVDAGPLVDGKGGWILWNGTWSQLKDLGSNLDYNFLIRAVVGSSTTDVQTVRRDTFNISIYPNPVTLESKFGFSLPEPGTVGIEIYNMLGQLVGNIPNTKYETGEYSVPFNSSGLPSGIYLYNVIYTSTTGQFRKTNKLTIIK